MGPLDMDLHDIYGIMNRWQIREILEPNHNLKQILPFGHLIQLLKATLTT